MKKGRSPDRFSGGGRNESEPVPGEENGFALIAWFEVECDSSESIHNHNACAYQKEVKGAFLGNERKGHR